MYFRIRIITPIYSGLNSYSWGEGNPVINVDPSGMQGESVVGACITAALSDGILPFGEGVCAALLVASAAAAIGVFSISRAASQIDLDNFQLALRNPFSSQFDYGDLDQFPPGSYPTGPVSPASASTVTAESIGTMQFSWPTTCNTGVCGNDLERLLQQLGVTAIALSARLYYDLVQTREREEELTIPVPPEMKRRWRCNTKCQLAGPNTNTWCSGYLSGIGIGNTKPEACAVAKAVINAQVPQGCYKRHCGCDAPGNKDCREI